MSAIVKIRGWDGGILGAPLSKSTETPSKSLSGKPFWLLFHAFSFRLVMTSSSRRILWSLSFGGSVWVLGSGFVIGDSFEAIVSAV